VHHTFHLGYKKQSVCAVSAEAAAAAAAAGAICAADSPTAAAH
jgi:hypothetical protein